MTRERVMEIVSTARTKNERPNLRGLNLTSLDLSGLDFSGADLRDTNLSYSNLSHANLRNTNMAYANMHRTNLHYANLAFANLHNVAATRAELSDTILRHTFMHRADLTGANLSRAYMYSTNFRGADLSGVTMCGLFLDGLPSGRLILSPTPEGWHLTIGCWEGTIDTLREMIAKDVDWPVAEGEDITMRRPMLEVAAAMCETYAAAHPNALDEVRKTAERWEKNR